MFLISCQNNFSFLTPYSPLLLFNLPSVNKVNSCITCTNCFHFQSYYFSVCSSHLISPSLSDSSTIEFADVHRGRENMEGEIPPREINLSTNIFFSLISIGCPLRSTISLCELSLCYFVTQAFHSNASSACHKLLPVKLS